MVEAGKPCSVNYFTSPLRRVVVEENLQEILVVIIASTRRLLMTKPIVRDPTYRRRRFDAEIIELCVRRYITYRLSYLRSARRLLHQILVPGHSNGRGKGRAAATTWAGSRSK